VSLRLSLLGPLLALAFVAMMTIVVLRGGTTRLNYELSQLDQQAAVLRQELREKTLELARLRSPAVIREKCAALRLDAGATGSGASGRRSDRPG